MQLKHNTLQSTPIEQYKIAEGKIEIDKQEKTKAIADIKESLYATRLFAMAKVRQEVQFAEVAPTQQVRFDNVVVVWIAGAEGRYH